MTLRPGLLVKVEPRPAGERGMTLVEMIVVLAIIGITASAAALALGTGTNGSEQVEARRLVARLQLAADTAMVSDRALALSVTPRSYAIVERVDGARDWRETTLPGLGETRTLPAGMTLAADNRSTVLPLDADADGQGFSLILTRGQNHLAISFDGMTARLSDAGPGEQAQVPS
jgi:general secretion pathway protein H